MIDRLPDFTNWGIEDFGMYYQVLRGNEEKKKANLERQRWNKHIQTKAILLNVLRELEFSSSDEVIDFIDGGLRKTWKEDPAFAARAF